MAAFAARFLHEQLKLVYAGTGFHDGDTVPQIVGYETDRYMSKYPKPQSINATYTLVSLRPSLISNTGKADYANSSIYQATSGASVFAAGSMEFSQSRLYRHAAEDQPEYSQQIR